MHGKNFPGARFKCMQDYVKLSLRKKPHHLIIHIGSKDISINKQQVRIAKAIVELCDVIKHSSQRR